MSQADFLIGTAFLATKEQSTDRILLSGKIEDEKNPDCFLFYLIELVSEEISVAKKIVQVLTNTTKTAERFSDAMFERSLELINDTLGRLSETTSDTSWIGNINAVIGLVCKDEILLSQAGNITGYIFRKNKISSLTDQADESANHPNRTFAEITSGQIALGDQIVFGNNVLFNHLSIDRLRNFIKISNVREEILELSHYLKRNRIDDANAIFISAQTEIDHEIVDETVFIDEREESTIANLGKKVAPIANDFWQSVQKSLSAIQDLISIWSQKAAKSWQDNYGPKSKEILKKGSAKLQKSFSPEKIQFDELNPSKELKIKTNSYSRTSTHKNSFKLPRATWQKISFLGVIFDKKNRKFLYAGLIFIALIIGYAKIKENNDKRAAVIEKVAISASYDQANSAFTKAKEDILLGKTTDLTPIYTALTLATNAESDKNNHDKAIALVKSIKSFLDDRTKTVRYYDATNFTIGNNISKIVLASQKIYGISSDNKVYAVDTRDKQGQLVASLAKDAGAITDLNYSPTKTEIFFSTASNRLFSIDLSNNAVSEISNADSSWKNLNAVSNYSTNIYTLDPVTGAVWKYTETTNTYSKASNYADTKNISLKNAVDLAVDGNIFALLSNNQVAKFVRGSYQSDFALGKISGAQSALGQSTKIFTDENTNSIFILDKQNNRIVKFDKSGAFANQYIFDGVTIENFVVDAKIQKIWALSGGKVYEGNL